MIYHITTTQHFATFHTTYHLQFHLVRGCHTIGTLCDTVLVTSNYYASQQNKFMDIVKCKNNGERNVFHFNKYKKSSDHFINYFPL